MIERQKGLTLVELIIGLAISTIIVSTIFAFLNSAVTMFMYYDKKSYENFQYNKIVNEVVNDLKNNATVIAVPRTGDTSDKKVTELTYIGGDLSERTIKLGTQKGVNDKTLYKKSNVPITENCVESINFARNDPSGRFVTITLSICSPKYKERFPNPMTQEITVHIRNLQAP